MNRPNKEDYGTWKKCPEGWERRLHSIDYQLDLEKYCDKLEKRETPMKVNKKIIDRREIKDSGTFRTIYLFSCPNCGICLSPPHDENYCSKCGQRLEYEDD